MLAALKRRRATQWSMHEEYPSQIHAVYRFAGMSITFMICMVHSWHAMLNHSPVIECICGRYAKPGNCSMGKFRTADGKTDWLKAVLQDDSPCTPGTLMQGTEDIHFFD